MDPNPDELVITAVVSVYLLLTEHYGLNPNALDLNYICDQIEDKVKAAMDRRQWDEAQKRRQEIVNVLVDLGLSVDELIVACDAFRSKPKHAGFLLALPIEVRRQWVRHIAGV